MNCERSLIAAVVFLATGIGLIFGFTHGTVGFGAAYPIAGTSFEISLKTMGAPALGGVIATLLGILLLLIALVQAVVAQIPHGAVNTPNTKAV